MDECRLSDTRTSGSTTGQFRAVRSRAARHVVVAPTVSRRNLRVCGQTPVRVTRHATRRMTTTLRMRATMSAKRLGRRALARAGLRAIRSRPVVRDLRASVTAGRAATYLTEEVVVSAPVAAGVNCTGPLSSPSNAFVRAAESALHAVDPHPAARDVLTRFYELVQPRSWSDWRGLVETRNPPLTEVPAGVGWMPWRNQPIRVSSELSQDDEARESSGRFRGRRRSRMGVRRARESGQSGLRKLASGSGQVDAAARLQTR